jgi:hypothetical protein
LLRKRQEWSIIGGGAQRLYGPEDKMTAATVQQQEQPAARLPQVRVTQAILATAAVFIAWYISGPLMTLWRIDQAVRRADAAALETLIDWGRVRQGLTQDVSEGLLGLPGQTASAGNALPPFGAGFVRGVVGSTIDREVTPQALLAAARPLARSGSGIGALARALSGAAFIAPDTFDLRLRTLGASTDEPPLHVRLQLRRWQWRVVRVWIPQDMVDEASSRT